MRTSYRDIVLADRPRALWSLGDISVSGLPVNARDETMRHGGGGYTGSGTNGVYGYGEACGIPGGQGFGHTARFGNTFHLEWPTSARQSVAEFSREVWVRTTYTGGTQFLLAQYGAAEGEDFWELHAASTYRMFMYRGGFVYDHNGIGGVPTRGTSIQDGRLHHLAYTRGASRVKLYVDGDLRIDTTGGGAQTLLTTCRGSTGRQLVDNVNNFIGTMQYAAIYDYELSRDQVLRHYFAGRGLGRSTVRRAA